MTAMRKVTLVVLLRLVLLVAVAASAALFVEYQHAGDPAFCGVGSGCLAVRLSPYSRLFGVALPNIGLAAYAGLFLLYLLARTKEALRFGAVATGVGGLAALVLIYLQGAKIHAFCKWCVIVDASAIVAAVLAMILAREPDAEVEAGAIARHRGITASWTVAFVLAIGAPFFWASYPVIPPLPPPIDALQVPGKVTIVAFTDFECPFCRGLHPILHEVIAQHPDRIALVRKMMPLSGHLGAMPAALAYMCTPEKDREKMVDALYSAPEAELTPEGVIAIGVKNGLNSDDLARCVAGEGTRAAVERDMNLFTEVKGQALPLTYIGPRVILGFNPDRLKNAVDLELQGAQPSLPVAFMLALLGVAFATAAGVTFRLAPAKVKGP